MKFKCPASKQAFLFKAQQISCFILFGAHLFFCGAGHSYGWFLLLRHLQVRATEGCSSGRVVLPAGCPHPPLHCGGDLRTQRIHAGQSINNACGGKQG